VAVPHVTWSAWEALAVFLVGNALVGQILIIGLLELAGVHQVDELSDTMAVVANIVVDLAFVAVMVGWMSHRHPGWLVQLGMPGDAWLGMAVWGFGAGILLYPIIAIVVGLPLQVLYSALSGVHAVTPAQLPSDLSLGAKVLAAFFAVFIAPPTEELFFRGLLFRSIRDRHGFWTGAIASGLIFGLVHYVQAPWQNAVLLQSVMVFTGIGLAWIYERRGTIVANIAAHMAFNVIGLVIIFGR
jgi:membrane protease YdiL (CAAX protease family)